MLWFFERRGRHARLEVLCLDRYKYEMHFVDADGNESVEHFKHADDAPNASSKSSSRSPTKAGITPGAGSSNEHHRLPRRRPGGQRAGWRSKLSAAPCLRRSSAECDGFAGRV